MTTTRPEQSFSSQKEIMKSLSRLRSVTPAIINPNIVPIAPPTAVPTKPSVQKIIKPSRQRPADMPLKNIYKELTDKDKTVRNETKSFHTVYKLLLDKTLWFIKENDINSPMSPMEAAIGEVCRFLADDRVPECNAIYEMHGKIPVYTSVASQAVDFESLISHPLNVEDLNISVLSNKTYTLEELDAIDEEYTEKDDWKDLNPKATIRNKLPVIDLLRYHKIKNLTTILVLCYYMKDDDAHKGNVGNYNFDHDMKLWDLLFHFKCSSSAFWRAIQHIDKKYRKPTDITFKIDTIDLDNFPDIKHDSRFIWCNKTDPYGALISGLRDFLGNKLALAKNAFSKEENLLFKALQDHPAFKFNKNKMFLRLAIHNPKIYDPLMGLHIAEDLVAPAYSSEPIKPMMTANLLKRHQEFSDKLMASKQFMEALEQHGEYFYSVIERKYQLRNEKVEKEIESYKEEAATTSPNLLKINFENLKQKLQVNLTELRSNYDEYRRMINGFHTMLADDQPKVRFYP